MNGRLQIWNIPNNKCDGIDSTVSKGKEWRKNATREGLRKQFLGKVLPIFIELECFWIIVSLCVCLRVCVCACVLVCLRGSESICFFIIFVIMSLFHHFSYSCPSFSSSSFTSSSSFSSSSSSSSSSSIFRSQMIAIRLWSFLLCFTLFH